MIYPLSLNDSIFPLFVGQRVKVIILSVVSLFISFFVNKIQFKLNLLGRRNALIVQQYNVCPCCDCNLQGNDG